MDRVVSAGIPPLKPSSTRRIASSLTNCKMTWTSGPIAPRPLLRTSSAPLTNPLEQTVITIFKKNLKNINVQELTLLKYTLLKYQAEHQDPFTIIKTIYETRHKAYNIITTTHHTNVIKTILAMALNHNIYNYHSTHSPTPPHFKLHLDKHLSRSYINQTLYTDLTKPLLLQSTNPSPEILNIIAPPIEHQNHRGCTTYTILTEQTDTLTEALKSLITPFTTTHMRNSKIKWRPNKKPS